MKKGAPIGIAVVVVLAIVVIAVVHANKKMTTAKPKSNVAAINDAVLKTMTSSSLGKYLTTPSGQALYTYSGDSSGVSNCTGSCLAAWPAYQDTASTVGLPKGVSTIKRTDNSQIQFTYNGKPLYTFASDSNGQVTGNGVSGFSLASPTAAASSSTTTSSTPSQNQSNTNSSSSNPY